MNDDLVQPSRGFGTFHSPSSQSGIKTYQCGLSKLGRGGLGSGSYTDWSDPPVDHQDVVGGAFTVGSLSSIKFLLSQISLNSSSEWKPLVHFGKEGPRQWWVRDWVKQTSCVYINHERLGKLSKHLCWR